MESQHFYHACEWGRVGHVWGGGEMQRSWMCSCEGDAPKLDVSNMQ